MSSHLRFRQPPTLVVQVAGGLEVSISHTHEMLGERTELIGCDLPCVLRRRLRRPPIDLPIVTKPSQRVQIGQPDRFVPIATFHSPADILVEVDALDVVFCDFVIHRLVALL